MSKFSAEGGVKLEKYHVVYHFIGGSTVSQTVEAESKGMALNAAFNLSEKYARVETDHILTHVNLDNVTHIVVKKQLKLR